MSIPRKSSSTPNSISKQKGHKTIIVGAGPAGLTAAYQLQKSGVKTHTLEMDTIVGGIARTVEHQGYRLDIGGHRFFTKVSAIESMWHEILGDEFLKRPRKSRVFYQGKFFDYPLRATDVFWKLGPFTSFKAILSYAWSQIFPRRPEVSMKDWVVNHFGENLYRTFFESYTYKVWGIPCSEIGADWAAQRIKGLCLKKAILSAIFPKAGNQPKTLINSFSYPRLGPGQMWETATKKIEEFGGQVDLETKVTAINHQNGTVSSVETRGKLGDKKLAADSVVSSMPLSQLIEVLSPAAPPSVKDAAAALRYRDFIVVALMIDGADLFSDNWIYIHEPSVKVGRVQNFGNWSPDMVPDSTKSCLGFEYFCAEGDELWESSDEELIELALKEGVSTGLLSKSQLITSKVVRMPKAYPVYNQEYLKHVNVIKEFLDSFSNLHTVGRNGLHKYNNQDHSMFTAMLAVRNILGEEHNVWSVNADCEYHEELSSDYQATNKVVGHVPVPPAPRIEKKVING